MTRTTKAHARCLNLFENDLLIIHRGDTDQLADMYERGIMNDEARLTIDALLALEASVKPLPVGTFQIEEFPHELGQTLDNLWESLNDPRLKELE